MVHLLYFHFLSRADITKRPFKLHLYLPFCNPLSADAFLPAITICAGREGVKEVDVSGGSGIIKNDSSGTTVQNVHYIGKIDLGIYKCVSGDIQTDEAIITDNRIEHIVERRGREFYDEFSSLFNSILTDPDYIFSGKNPNTAIVSKRFTEHAKSINIILKLSVKGDNPNFKNSILTVIGENNKRFEQRLRNNVPLYSKNIDKTE